MLGHVVDYCAAHQVTADEATVVEFGRDTGLALAGAGAPWASEFAVIELAAALGMTADACRRHVGRVLEVRYRACRSSRSSSSPAFAADLATRGGR